MITKKQQSIARKEAKRIVKQYLENRNEKELQDEIFEAIIEALKHNSFPTQDQLLLVATELGYRCRESGYSLKKTLSKASVAINSGRILK